MSAEIILTSWMAGQVIRVTYACSSVDFCSIAAIIPMIRNGVAKSPVSRIISIVDWKSYRREIWPVVQAHDKCTARPCCCAGLDCMVFAFNFRECSKLPDHVGQCSFCHDAAKCRLDAILRSGRDKKLNRLIPINIRHGRLPCANIQHEWCAFFFADARCSNADGVARIKKMPSDMFAVSRDMVREIQHDD